jgi:tripartite-type tricarboxylate transporter receptor subunit TctC
VDWVDGAYRGIGVPRTTPPELRKQISDMMDAINKDPETRRRMYELGFEVTDITYDQMPKFMKDRTADYMGAAKLLGLAK